MSTQYCGCDPTAKPGPHVCTFHQACGTYETPGVTARIVNIDVGQKPLNEIATVCNDAARAKGFVTNGPPNLDQMLLLIVGEVTEAQEELRAGHGITEVYYNGDNPKPEGFPIEIADALIRILQMCGRCEIDIAQAVETKLRYNATRPHKHGKVF